ncbi:MAG: bifunctional nuclease family protein [Prevotella shahii]|jgi:hypothetical protein|uniref:DUF151 domain-containing protein n=1 Tax=Hoylesella shahii TaxID=228603 RepID=UPI001CB46ECD|nr:DUF151 domain-containing protein [Hoylesella shahii]MBF1591012.1 bifunctional nuclease family protein [Hoylesella shahii]
MKSKIRLVFNNVAEIVGEERLGLLSLTDEEQTMELLIPCEREIKEQLTLRLKSRTVTSTLLPEVLWQMVLANTDANFEIIIDDIVDSQYRVLLYNTLTLQPAKLRASDAVLLSIIGNIPIYVETSLMARQATPFKKNSMGASLPINVLDDKLIEEALAKAIKHENYELASRINEEIKRRKDKLK